MDTNLQEESIELEIDEELYSKLVRIAKEKKIATVDELCSQIVKEALAKDTDDPNKS